MEIISTQQFENEVKKQRNLVKLILITFFAIPLLNRSVYAMSEGNEVYYILDIVSIILLFTRYITELIMFYIFYITSKFFLEAIKT